MALVGRLSLCCLGRGALAQSIAGDKGCMTVEGECISGGEWSSPPPGDLAGVVGGTADRPPGPGDSASAAFGFTKGDHRCAARVTVAYFVSRCVGDEGGTRSPTGFDVTRTRVA